MILPVLTVLCLVLSLFFAFALIGYRTIALAFAGFALLFFLLWLLGRWDNEKTAALLRRILLTLVAAGLLVLAVVEIPIVRHARTDKEPQADYLIVLGAGLNGRAPSLSLTNRLTAALDYLETYPQAVAIVSGGKGPGEEITEASAMYQWLTGRGIAQERVIMEDKATSTEENIRFSLEIIEARGDAGASLAVVSSEYHLYRAKCIGADCGAALKGVAGHTSYPVLRLNYFLREAFAVLYMWCF